MLEGMQLQRHQEWNIIVDHPIEFLPNLSMLNIFEDDTLFLPTDSLFYNVDDRGELITSDYFIISQSNQYFWASANNLEIRKVKVIHKRRRVINS